MSGEMMWAATLHGREDVRVEMVPVPPVGPGEVRLRIQAALTCGTDVKVWRRGYHAKMIDPPALFGHEFAGEVDAVGDGVTGWKPGDRVVAPNSAPCGTCFFCRKGTPALCEDLLFVNGAYAEFITLPRRLVDINLLRCPDHLAFEYAALTEPLACVLHGVEKTGIEPHQTVVVIGDGQIGQMFVRLCELSGARVICVGRIAERLQLAMRMGADAVLDSGSEPTIVERVRSLTEGGHGPDRVIECVGLPDTWHLAVAMARKGGVVNLFGGCPHDTFLKVDTSRIHYDELTIMGTFHHTPHTVRRALELLADGVFPAHQLVTQVAPLREVPAVLRTLANGAPVTKVAIACAQTPQTQP